MNRSTFAVGRTPAMSRAREEVEGGVWGGAGAPCAEEPLSEQLLLSEPAASDVKEVAVAGDSRETGEDGRAAAR